MENKLLCVKTIKLRGIYSECLIIKPESVGLDSNKLQEGEDLMKELDIFKYEPPVKNIQLASGKRIRYSENPNFHIYYKFPNIKNVPGIFNEEDEVNITRKLHGTNARFGLCKKNKLSFFDKIKKFFRIANEWIDYEFVVGSHNVEKGSDSQGFYDSNVWYEIAETYKIKEKLWKYVKSSGKDMIGDGIVLYGEIYGKGIQGNFDYGLETIDFAAFDISINKTYMPHEVFKFLINSELRLPIVPILYEGKWNQEIQDKYTFNNNIEGTKIPHEGIVIKHESGERQKIAKVINPEYLIYAEKKNVEDSH